MARCPHRLLVAPTFVRTTKSKIIPSLALAPPIIPTLSPVIPAKAGIQKAAKPRPPLSESGFTGLAGFSGFHSAQVEIFAINGNPAKTNLEERLPIKDEIVES